MKKRITDATRAVAELQRVLKKHDREMSEPLDPFLDGAEEIADLKAEIRSLARRRSLPADMTCPSCLNRKPNTRQWTGKGDICRACETVQNGIRPVKFEMPEILTASILRELRERIGVSCSDFAAHCGWSGTYQARLERETTKELNPRTVAILTKTFRLLLDSGYRK